MRLPSANCQMTGAAGRRGAGLPLGQRRAFSLVEILLVVGLLSIIIIGLMAMFGQTQRAFRSSMTQVDVLESGRMVTDLIGRDLEQVTPSYLSGTLNFYADVPSGGGYVAPFLQPLPGSAKQRMNLIEDLFFLTKRNQEWIGIGYFVRTNSPINGQLGLSPVGLGSLYRFETNAPVMSGRTPYQMFTEFGQARANEANVSKIADGVIHFKVRCFDTNGIWITNNIPITNNFAVSTNIFAGYSYYSAPVLRGEVEYYAFYSNAVPASVELELGILEDRAWERFQSLPDANSQYRYLTNQTGRVHLFRQRIPIRNVDPTAYR